MSGVEETVCPSSGNRGGFRVFIETYGCQMNVADSQLIRGVLAQAGYRNTEKIEEADVILVNTCAVRENAEDRVLGVLRSLKHFKTDGIARIIGVCGCMAEHHRERILKLVSHVDLVVGPDSYRRLPEHIEAACTGAPIIDVQRNRHETYDGVTGAKAEGIHGWISIQRGCDKFCSFCIVPFVRGRQRASAPREVLRSARSLAEQGAVEVTLLGQTVNSYRYEQTEFADLLKAVARIDGIKRVRFTSPHPLDFSDDLIETLGTEPKVMPHLHLPLQSGCDAVLESMKRGYTAGEYLALVAKLRASVNRLALSTDIVVGFPGESDRSFDRTLDVIREIRFDSAFMFAYSQRSHTYAARHLVDDVVDAKKKERLARLIRIQEKISSEKNKEYLGETVGVLVAGLSKRNKEDFVGKTDTFKTTVFPSGQEQLANVLGRVVDVFVRQTTAHTLLGTVGKPSDEK